MRMRWTGHVAGIGGRREIQDFGGKGHCFEEMAIYVEA